MGKPFKVGVKSLGCFYLPKNKFSCIIGIIKKYNYEKYI